MVWGQVLHTFFARALAAIIALILSHMWETAHKNSLQRSVNSRSFSQILTFLFFILGNSSPLKQGDGSTWKQSELLDNPTGLPGHSGTTSVDSAERGFRSSTNHREIESPESCRHVQAMTQQDSMPFCVKNEQITLYSTTDGRIMSERGSCYDRRNCIPGFSQITQAVFEWL